MARTTTPLLDLCMRREYSCNPKAAVTGSNSQPAVPNTKHNRRTLAVNILAHPGMEGFPEHSPKVMRQAAQSSHWRYSGGMFAGYQEWTGMQSNRAPSWKEKLVVAAAMMCLFLSSTAPVLASLHAEKQRIEAMLARWREWWNLSERELAAIGRTEMEFYCSAASCFGLGIYSHNEICGHNREVAERFGEVVVAEVPKELS